jgi:predicted dehydrogenase
LATVRVGIIGCGGIAAFAHVPGLLNRSGAPVEILYLCDLDTNRAQLLADQFVIATAKVLDEPSAIMGDDRVDAVIVTDWPATHSSHALQAIAADKHVLIQKPAVLDARSGQRLLAAARSSRKNVMALPAMDFVPGVSKLKSLLCEDVLGDIPFARVRVNIPGPEDYHRDVRRFFAEDVTLPGAIFSREYADAAGCSADMGPYALALIYSLFGQARLLHVYKSSATFEKSSLLVFDLSNSSSADEAISHCAVELGWGQYPANELCIVMGAAATAILSMGGNFELFPESPDPVEVLYSADRATAIVPPGPTQGQDRWLDAVVDGREQQFITSVAAAAWAGGILEILGEHKRGRQAQRCSRIPT